MATAKDWIVTFRLRTLPLSLSTIILGSLLAAYKGSFDVQVFIWAILTTLFLQILSNLANDYGDAVHGVDSQGRIGPKRSLQTGAITLREMRRAVILFVVLSLVAGVVLLYFSFRDVQSWSGIWMFLIGLGAIAAALKYTVGKNPYGYAGFGDVFVFIFFGLVGVVGSYFLHVHQVTIAEFLPAASVGFFSTGVLNLNNLRDRDNDAAFGKRTLVVKLGLERAKRYHAALLILGMLTAICYSVFHPAAGWKWIYLLSFPLIIRSILKVLRNNNPVDLEPELKNLSLSTLLFSILFGIGLII